MKPAFCFIDDADFELAMFRENAAPAFAGLEPVLAKSWQQCLDLLAGRSPLFFLLDLYGAEPGAETAMPGPEQVAATLAGAMPLTDIFRQAEEDPSDPGNALLRGIHGEAARWQRAFLAAAESLGQSPAFGLKHLSLARRHFPAAAALGYSRKALYGDAHAFTLAGGCGTLQKPQGAGPAEIAAATRAQAPDLARAASRAVTRRLALLGGGLLADLVAKGPAGGLATGLARALSALQEPTPPAEAFAPLAGQAALALPAQRRQLAENICLWGKHLASAPAL